LIKTWEELREFSEGLHRFKANIENNDWDGSYQDRENQKKREALDKLTTPKTCWVDSYTRGAPTLVDSCPNGKQPARKDSDKPASRSYGDTSATDRSGMMCYPPCPEGMSGSGPVCW